MTDTPPLKPSLRTVGGKTKTTDSLVARSNANWEKIEVEWYMGVKPVTQLAREQGITPGTIYKRAQRYNWGRRDLSGIAKIACDAALIRRAVESLDDKADVAKALEVIGEAAAADAGGALIERYADLVAGIVEEHRAVSKTGRDLAAKLVALATECFEAIRSAFDDPLQHQRMLDVHSRILHRLAQATGVWVKIEREAYGMGVEEGDQGETKSYEEYLREAKAQGRIK